jgi:hypothetical protein
MKLFGNFLSRSVTLSALAAAAIFALQPDVQGADKHHRGGSSHHGGHSSHHGSVHHSSHRGGGGGGHHHSYAHHGHYRSGYAAWDGGWRPRHRGWVVVWADGWRGPGYYYGPPGIGYYDQGPGVTFYASRRAVPSGLSVTIR